MSKKILNNSEIVKFLEEDIGVEGPTALGEHFGKDRQVFGNFARRSKVDINNEVISYLISRIKDLEGVS